MSDERSKRDGRSEEFENSPSANDVATGSEAGRSDADTSSGNVASSSASTPSGKRSRSGSGVSMTKAAATSTAATKNRPSKVRQSKAKADKRPNIFVRLLQFLREVVTELRKVIWPNKKQMVTYTSVVLVFLAFMVAFISGLDLLFIKGVGWLFG